MEKHYYHDGEKQLCSFKKIHLRAKRLIKKKDTLAMLSFYFLRRIKMHYKKKRIPICLFGTSRTQDIAKCHILHEESWPTIIFITF